MDKWKNNMGLKTNWAEIYEDYNEHNSPDIDSTPGNNKKEKMISMKHQLS